MRRACRYAAGEICGSQHWDVLLRTYHPSADVGSDTEAPARSQPGMKLSQKVQVAKILAAEELTIWPLNQQLGRKPPIKVKQAPLRPHEEKPGHNFSTWFLNGAVETGAVATLRQAPLRSHEE